MIDSGLTTVSVLDHIIIIYQILSSYLSLLTPRHGHVDYRVTVILENWRIGNVRKTRQPRMIFDPKYIFSFFGA